KGRTTCGFFFPDGRRAIYASTHLAGAACPSPPDRSAGYVWPIYPAYDIFAVDLDGGNLTRLSDREGYDAEGAVSPDGRNARRLTDGVGYDGGAFFSWDGRFIVFRAGRPADAAEQADYRALLGQG